MNLGCAREERASSLHEYLGRKDTKNSTKDRGWSCTSLLPTRVCVKEIPSELQSTGWEHYD